MTNILAFRSTIMKMNLPRYKSVSNLVKFVEVGDRILLPYAMHAQFKRIPKKTINKKHLIPTVLLKGNVANARNFFAIYECVSSVTTAF